MERPGGTAGTTVMQCPGCLVAVDVTRPPGVDVNVQRGTHGDERVMIVYVGRVQVHRCVQCGDGQWR